MSFAVRALRGNWEIGEIGVRVDLSSPFFQSPRPNPAKSTLTPISSLLERVCCAHLLSMRGNFDGILPKSPIVTTNPRFLLAI